MSAFMETDSPSNNDINEDKQDSYISDNLVDSSSLYNYEYVSCGDVITQETNVVMGHGTAVNSRGKLISTIAGFVERVNKLISVKALNSRYSGEIVHFVISTADVIVGRIVSLGEKKWKVDVGSRSLAVLSLSSINLPGGVQRRKTAEDSLSMRDLFKENDLISAEVQKVSSNGIISLHTRNSKYRKLLGGQIIQVPQALIKRCKHHFQSLDCGVDIILGTNGFIWIQPPTTGNNSSDSNSMLVDAEFKLSSNSGNTTGPANSNVSYSVLTSDMREKIARVRNSIHALSVSYIAIYNVTIQDVYDYSISLGLPAKALCNPDLIATITQTAMARRTKPAVATE